MHAGSSCPGPLSVSRHVLSYALTPPYLDKSAVSDNATGQRRVVQATRLRALLGAREGKLECAHGNTSHEREEERGKRNELKWRRLDCFKKGKKAFNPTVSNVGNQVFCLHTYAFKDDAHRLVVSYAVSTPGSGWAGCLSPRSPVHLDAPIAPARGKSIHECAREEDHLQRRGPRTNRWPSCHGAPGLAPVTSLTPTRFK